MSVEAGQLSHRFERLREAPQLTKLKTVTNVVECSNQHFPSLTIRKVNFYL